MKDLKNNTGKAKCCYYNEDCPICPREDGQESNEHKCFCMEKGFRSQIDTCTCDCHKSRSNDLQVEKELQVLKIFMSDMFGHEIGRKDDIEHLMYMAKLAIDEWMKSNKDLESKLKIAVEALNSAATSSYPHDEETHTICCEALSKIENE